MKPCYDNKVMSSVWWSTIKYSQKTLGSSFVAYDIQVTAFVHVEVIFVACFTSTRRFFFNEIVTQRIFFFACNATSRARAATTTNTKTMTTKEQRK